MTGQSARSVIEQHPAFVVWAEEGARLAEQGRALDEQLVAEIAKRDKAIADHQVKVRSAYEGRKTVPVQPVLLDLTHLDQAKAMHRAAKRTHDEQRGPMLAEVADSGGVDAARERLLVQMTNAVDVVRKVMHERDEIAASLKVLAELVNASETRNGTVVRSGRAAAIETRATTLTLDDLVAHVLSGRPFDDVGTLGTKIERVTKEDDEAADAALRRQADQRADAYRRIKLGSGAPLGLTALTPGVFSDTASRPVVQQVPLTAPVSAKEPPSPRPAPTAWPG